MIDIALLVGAFALFVSPLVIGVHRACKRIDAQIERVGRDS